SSAICATCACTGSWRARTRSCASSSPAACSPARIEGMPAMSAIAFIGLGNMGRPMAANLMKAGHRVVVFDVDAKALQGHTNSGGRAAESARDAVQGADVVISMLPAGEHVRALYM